LFVTHDADDGGWQFLCGAEHETSHAMTVCTGEMVDMDPTLIGLHDMPEGTERHGSQSVHGGRPHAHTGCGELAKLPTLIDRTRCTPHAPVGVTPEG